MQIAILARFPETLTPHLVLFLINELLSPNDVARCYLPSATLSHKCRTSGTWSDIKVILSGRQCHDHHIQRRSLRMETDCRAERVPLTMSARPRSISSDCASGVASRRSLTTASGRASKACTRCRRFRTRCTKPSSQGAPLVGDRPPACDRCVAAGLQHEWCVFC